MTTAAKIKLTQTGEALILHVLQNGVGGRISDTKLRYGRNVPGNAETVRKVIKDGALVGIQGTDAYAVSPAGLEAFAATHSGKWYNEQRAYEEARITVDNGWEALNGGQPSDPEGLLAKAEYAALDGAEGYAKELRESAANLALRNRIRATYLTGVDAQDIVEIHAIQGKLQHIRFACGIQISGSNRVNTPDDWHVYFHNIESTVRYDAPDRYAQMTAEAQHIGALLMGAALIALRMNASHE